EHRRDEREIESQCERQSVMPGDRREQNCGERFDCGIAAGYVHAAIAAASAENQITNNRNVVVRLDGRLALWASGIGENNRLFARHAMNDDVEKAADDPADDAEESAGNWQRYIEGEIDRRHAHLKTL